MRSVELRPQLMRGPQIVIVEKGDPTPTSGFDAAVSGAGGPDARVVADDPHSFVGQTCQGRSQFGPRAVIDDNDLQVHILLSDRLLDSNEAQRPSVARWDHYGHLG